MTMNADQESLAAEILADFTPIGEVPPAFEEFVLGRIASRPSPAPPGPDPLTEIRAQLDEILTLLRGGTPE